MTAHRRDESPEVKGDRTWFERMQSLYRESRPEDPEEVDARIKRGMAWAVRIDPRSARAAIERLILESGLADVAGVTDGGELVFQRNETQPGR